MAAGVTLLTRSACIGIARRVVDYTAIQVTKARIVLWTPVTGRLASLIFSNLRDYVYRMISLADKLRLADGVVPENPL